MDRLLLTWLLILPFVGFARAGGDDNSTHDWSYLGDTGPLHWKEMEGNEKCGANSQSPINIKDATYDRDMSPVTLNNYDTSSLTLSMDNNGHSVTVHVDGADLTISGGKLPDTYKLVQFHWHWGGHNDRGSEHTVKGEAYAMEMHLVHYATKYPNVSAAAVEKEGLAVLGFFFDVVENDVDALNFVTEKLKAIPFSGNSVDLETKTIGSLLPAAADMKDYFRYAGSLTTPGCYESVVWTVFKDHLKISQAQLDTFRGLFFNELGASHNESMDDNYRPVQPLNDRTIYSSFDSDTGGATGLAQYRLTLTLAALLAVSLWLRN